MNTMCEYSEHNWSQYQSIKSNFDLDSIKLWSNRLISLLNGICLNNEYIVLKGVSKRITIRLRTAKVSRLIKHSNKCLSDLFELRIPEVINENIWTLINEDYDISTGAVVLPFRHQIDIVLHNFVKSASILRKFIFISLNIFGQCIQWLRSGHLAPHFLMLSSSLSRLNVISKAILVYINDLYSMLIPIKEELKEQQLIDRTQLVSLPVSLQHYLSELNIKCLKKSNKEQKESEPQIEDIGVPIERNEMQTKAKKKQKNKTKLKIKPKVNKQKTKSSKQKRKKF